VYTNYAIADAFNTGYATASFPSGWRTGTLNEYMNAEYYGGISYLAQKPFEGPFLQMWTSTGINNSLTDVMIISHPFSRVSVSKAGASGQRLPFKLGNISEF
jgi:hypothetical protein